MFTPAPQQLTSRHLEELPKISWYSEPYTSPELVSFWHFRSKKAPCFTRNLGEWTMNLESQDPEGSKTPLRTICFEDCRQYRYPNGYRSLQKHLGAKAEALLNWRALYNSSSSFSTKDKNKSCKNIAVARYSCAILEIHFTTTWLAENPSWPVPRCNYRIKSNHNMGHSLQSCKRGWDLGSSTSVSPAAALSSLLLFFMRL